MIRIQSGDLLQIEAGKGRATPLLSQFYYAFILEQISLFGGQLCFVPYARSDAPLTMIEVLKEPAEGFYAIVDFIFAKRDKRALKIAKKLNLETFNQGVEYFKGSYTGSFICDTGEKAKMWSIYDRNHSFIKSVTTLSEEQMRYPLNVRIDDYTMGDMVDLRWSPEKDPRI